MKMFFAIAAFGSVLWTVRFSAMPTAGAVVAEAVRPGTAPASLFNPTPSEPSSGQEASGESPAANPVFRPIAQRVAIPIAWQRTKARAVGKGTSTLTESFREVWTLELRPGGYLTLASPRARVPVFPATSGEPRTELPRSVVLSEEDFARLVGVLSVARGPEGDQGEPAEAMPSSRPLTLNLARSAKGGADVTLAWSEDEHYAIHLDFANVAIF